MSGFGTYLRRLWDQKPQAYGPFEYAQYSLFRNLEDFYSIDKDHCSLAMPMWGPGDQRDYSKNGLVGTSSGVTFGKNSLSFDGVNDYVDLGRSIEVDLLLTDQLSIMTKLRLTKSSNSTTPNRILHYNNMLSFGHGGVEAGVTNKLYFWFYGNDVSAPANLISTSPLSIGSSNSVAITYDKIASKIFFGGTQEDSHSFVGTFQTPSANLYIGADEDLSTRWLGAVLDYMLIFSVGIAADQVALISENPNQLWQPVPQKTIFLPLGGSLLPIKLIVDMQNTTSTTGVNSEILRNLETTILSNTSTSDISITVIRSIISNLTNTTSTTSINIILDILIRLIANINNGTNTTDISPTIIRNLSILTDNLTSVSSVSVEILRNLFVDLNNSTYTSDIEIIIDALIKLNVSINNLTSATNINSIMVRNLSIMVENITSTSSVHLQMLRRMFADVVNSTSTTDIDIILSNIISIIVSISNTTSSASIDKHTKRALFSNILNLTSSSAIDILKKISLNIKIENSTSIEDISNIVLRSLNVDIQNTTLTSNDVVIILNVLLICGTDVLAVKLLQDILVCTVNQDILVCTVNQDILVCTVNN